MSGVNTEAIGGEKLIITAGGIDTHIHFICPQVAHGRASCGHRGTVALSWAWARGTIGRFGHLSLSAL